jgi:hypothetical protein
MADAIAPGANACDGSAASATMLARAALENMADELSVLERACTSPLGGMPVDMLANVLHRIAERARSVSGVVGVMHRAELAVAKTAESGAVQPQDCTKWVAAYAE